MWAFKAIPPPAPLPYGFFVMKGWRIRVEWSGEKRFSSAICFFVVVVVVAIEMTFLRKGKNFSSPISQGQSSILQPSVHLGLTSDLWSAEGE